VKLTGTARLILDAKRTGLIAVPPDETVLRALELMAEHDIGAVIVLDADKPIGILSERDYARQVEPKGRTARETRVREIMTTIVMTVRPEDSVELCNTLMHRHRIRHLPVIEDGRAVGMLSIRDVLAELVVEEEERIHELETERLMIQTGSY
jgi:CBS domain-containing protein